MTDPFYQNQNVPVATQPQPQQVIPQQQAAPQLSPQQQQQLTVLAQQEQAIQQQIVQLNNALKTQQLLPQQQQQVAKQIQQYNMQLQYIAQQRQQMGVIHTNKPVVHPHTKKWKKVSMKNIMLGCFILLIFLIGWGALVFYSFIQSPERLTSMWLTVETAKNLLKTFVSVAFWLLTFLSFWLLIVNIYRLFTVKNKSKIWNVIWSFLWIIMLVWSIAGWVKLLWVIGNISPDDSINSQNLVLSYAEFKWESELIYDGLPLIAPMSLNYRLNGNIFNTQLLSKLWPVDLQKIAMSLDCWNEEILNLDLDTLQFQWKCLYTTKWKYQMILKVDYVNAQTQENLSQDVPVGFVDIKSEIVITNYWSDVPFDKNKTELVLWKVPRKVTFDASAIFKDFNLNDYHIVWDVDGDGTPDKENDSSFTYVYKKAQVYYVTFRLPDLNDILYTFPIRIEQSDVPICEISSTMLKWAEYSFVTDFIENNEIIESYIFSILDIKNNKVIDTIKSNNNYLKYNFPWVWVYAVQTTFQTSEWKKWSCEWDNINIWTADFEIYYDFLYKTPTAPSFKIMWSEWPVSINESIITVNEIPTILQVKLNKIVPDRETATKKVFINDEAILSLDDKLFEVTIDNNSDYNLSIVVEDINRDIRTEKKFIVKIQREDIIWKILVNPDAIGTEPFLVQFDTSTSTVNDPDDEIVYFSWDFGDWKMEKNNSQAITTHTYSYDYENEQWIYNPSLTITTRKWRTKVVSLDNPIIVKKSHESFVINLDSHPGQLAKIWDNITLSLELNWLPERIVWDFGDTNQLECKWRECVEATHMYAAPGRYTIKVTIYEAQRAAVDSTITLKVE